MVGVAFICCTFVAKIKCQLKVINYPEIGTMTLTTASP